MDEGKTYRTKTRDALLGCLWMSLGGTVLATLGGVGLIWILDRLEFLSWGWLLAAMLFVFCTIFGFALRWSMWTELQSGRVTRR